MTLFIGPYNGKVTGQQKMFRLSCDSMKFKLIIDSPNDKNLFSVVKNILKILFNIKQINSVYITVSRSRLGFLRDLFYTIIPIFAAKPIIAHLHGSDLLDYYSNENFLLKRLLRFFYSNCCCHIGLLKEMKKEFSFIDKKIPYYVVFNSV